MKTTQFRPFFAVGFPTTVLLVCTLSTTSAFATPGVTVGYFTDVSTSDTGPSSAITIAGYTPVQITNISTFDLTQINMLMIDESDNSGVSVALSNRLSVVRSWVNGGGKLIVHDRSVGNVANPSPLVVGAPGVLLTRDLTGDVNVIPPATTLVTAGPFGIINNTNLDGGTYSAHGYATNSNLPAGTRPILSVGANTNEVAAFSYPLGRGFVYYSTIPLDVYLDFPTSTLGSNMAKIYTPNVLAYMNSLQPFVVGYYTDQNTGDTAPAAVISRAGFVPLQISDISTFDFGQTSMLMIDEANNNVISAALSNRLGAVQGWVNAGGKVIVHDRSAGNVPNPSPLVVGAPSVQLTRLTGANIDVIAPATTLVTSGPFGTVDNTNLDNGDSSEHGYATNTTLPTGTRSILSTGTGSSQVAAFSYPLGKGFVYYSTIPADYYLDAPSDSIGSNVDNIYLPNVLLYVNSLQYLAVGYFTDANTNDTAPTAAILQAGFAPVQITNITTFDLNQIGMLMIDEANNFTISTALSNSLGAVQTWVNAGGKVIVHDRSVGNIANPSPLVIGAPGVQLARLQTGDVNVIPPATTLVTAGPYGTIDNTSLDLGGSSVHGYATNSSLPSGARAILCDGTNTSNVCSFSYPLGNGFAYYSGIPLDFYLDNPTGTPGSNMAKVYTPNVLVYMNSLAPTFVGYYTDQITNDNGPAAPISLAGFSGVKITDISSFDFSQIGILMIDESDNNTISATLLGRLPAVQSWVNAGGKVIVHDRSSGDVANPSPLVIGAPGVSLTRLEGSDVDVIPPTNSLVTSGPFGNIGNTTLDGGNNSEHGWAVNGGLPPGSRAILCVGGNTNEVVAFSYPLGGGNAFYSTIPIDFYLDNIFDTIGTNVDNIYVPNVLTYVNSLQPELLLINPSRSGSVFTATLKYTTPGTLYFLDYTTSLNPPVWTQVNSFAGNGGPIPVTDPGASGPSRYYRVRR